MPPLTTIIADDIAKERSLVRQFLCDYCPELHIIAETGTIAATFEAVCHHQPDLLFLDIDFNEAKTGFNLIQDLLKADALCCQVIFMSGNLTHPDKPYALYALRYASLPVLEKPFILAKLRMAVEQALLLADDPNKEQRQAQYKVGISHMQTHELARKPIMIRTSAKTYVQVQTSDIIYIQTDPHSRTTTYLYLRHAPQMRSYERIGFYDFLAEEDPNFMRVFQSQSARGETLRCPKPSFDHEQRGQIASSSSKRRLGWTVVGSIVAEAFTKLYAI